MGDGFTIPIEGDADGFRRELQALRDALGKVVDALGAQAKAADRAGASGSSGMDRMLKRSADVGTSVMGVASGLELAGKAARGLGRVRMASGIGQAVSGSRNLRGGLKAVMGSMRSLMRSRTFRVLAVGAVATAAAVISVRTAWKVVGGAAAGAGRLMRGVFEGGKAGARGLRSMLSSAANAARGLMGVFAGPALPIAGLLSLASAMALFGVETKKSLGAAADFEEMRIRVEQFTGSAEAARDLFRELDSFEVKTPFEGSSIRDTAEKLLGAGIRSNVAGLVRDIGALSKNGQQLEELGDAVAKGFARGKFQTEELNKFLERGINLMPELEAVTGLAGDELRKAIEAGLSFDQVTAAIGRMSAEGGQFFGLLERQSRGSKGLLSTLRSGWDLLRREFGQPINDALRPVLSEGISLVAGMTDKAREMGRAVGRAISIMFAAFKGGRAGELFGAGLRVGVSVAIDALMRGLQGAIGFLAAALPRVFESAVALFRSKSFLIGIQALGRALSNQIAAGIRRAMGSEGAASRLDDLSRQNFALAGKGLSQGSRMVDLEKTLSQALKDGLEAFKGSSRGDGSPLGSSQAREDLRRIIGELKAGMAEIRKGAEVPGVDPSVSSSGDKPAGAGGAAASTPGGLPGFSTIASRMARVGGGGVGFTIFEPLTQEAKKQTGIQKKMERHLRKIAEGGGSSPAVYGV